MVDHLPSWELTYPPKNGTFEDDFPNFSRWDMLVPWRVHPQGVDVVVFHDPERFLRLLWKLLAFHRCLGSEGNPV